MLAASLLNQRSAPASTVHGDSGSTFLPPYLSPCVCRCPLVVCTM